MRVLIADHHGIVRSGPRTLLERRQVTIGILSMRDGWQHLFEPPHRAPGPVEPDDAIEDAEELQVGLADGARVTIRAIRPTDKRALVAGFERLSPESRYRRFFSPLERLSDADLRYLTEVDHTDHEAMICFTADSGETLGVARYVRSYEPAYAEVAVTVVDDWQGRGVATALLEALVLRAREAGITHFVALVLSENREAIELFRSLAPGRAEPRRSASGHMELLIDISGTDERRMPATLGRALRAAARGPLTINPWSVISRSIARLRQRS
jgi:GNAT superfamily N-acetyltransferase